MPSKADMIRLLEAELDLIEGGGYGRSVREPWKPVPMFQYSISCINHWFVPNHDPECHEDCALMDFVPDEQKKTGLPCHMIPLNEVGETVHSLEESGNRERLEEAVKEWLRATIKHLKEGLGDSDQPEDPSSVTY
jgi:hypothetical protein